MKSTVYFQVGESKFRVSAAHPAHTIDKTLQCFIQREARKDAISSDIDFALSTKYFLLSEEKT
jgi:hypothetical protein